jgi:hypothetical protein
MLLGFCYHLVQLARRHFGWVICSVNINKLGKIWTPNLKNN